MLNMMFTQKGYLMKKAFLGLSVLVFFLGLPLSSMALNISKSYSDSNDNFGYWNSLNIYDKISKSGTNYQYTINSQNKLDIKAFKKISLTQVDGKLYNTNYSDLYTSGTVKFLGSTIYSWSDRVKNSVSKSYKISKEWQSPKANFTVGVIPVTAQAKAPCTMGFNIGGSINTTNANLTMGPYAEAAANVSAGVGAGNKYAGASAGVKGSLNLLKSELKATGAVKWIEKKITSKVDWINTTLNGKVSLYAEVYILKIKKYYEKVIANWSGYSKTTNLYNGTVAL